MTAEATEYWTEFEKNNGEKVVARSEGKWIRLPDSADLWGLFVLTDKTFRYLYVAKDTRVGGMGMSSAVTDPPDRSEFTIDRNDLISAHSPRRGLFSWVGRNGFRRCTVVAKHAGTTWTYQFEADQSTGLIAALVKVCR